MQDKLDDPLLMVVVVQKRPESFEHAAHLVRRFALYEQFHHAHNVGVVVAVHEKVHYDLCGPQADVRVAGTNAGQDLVHPFWELLVFDVQVPHLLALEVQEHCGENRKQLDFRVGLVDDGPLELQAVLFFVF